ncbi:MAG TPA: nucleoside/nucleotide kinase family protein [Chitinolyticbacter sp.]|nr:nucleoside/nucleotide kinase family protein [Chitinolyticbacter sp.]
MSPALPQSVLDALNLLLADGRRKILGLVGEPGAGKSTLADALLAHLGERAVVVPMDGFHLANVELARLQRSARKGAPDTFDAAGYVALLARLRSQRGDEIVYAPAFRREIEEPIAGAIAVSPQVPLVITEGNYLLLESGHWAGVRPLLDAIWYVEVDAELRRQRLVERHMRFGRDEAAARAWVDQTDEPNARLIAQGRDGAHLIVRWPD